jgi:hypothetical protein
MSRAFCIPASFFLFCALVINILVTISLPAIPALDIVRTSYVTGVEPDNIEGGVTQARVSLLFSSIGLALISWSYSLVFGEDIFVVLWTPVHRSFVSETCLWSHLGERMLKLFTGDPAITDLITIHV